MTIPDFAVSSQEAGFDEFLKVLSIHIGLSTTKNQLKGCYKYYGFGNNKAACYDEAWWTTNIITPSEAIALLTGKQLTEREKPCANCKETIAECACMRNICVKCNKPVGNITFSHCDKCFDILHSEPTQESVKERNGDPSMDDMIKLVEELTQQTAHLQQQLKEAKEKIDYLQSIVDQRNSNSVTK